MQKKKEKVICMVEEDFATCDYNDENFDQRKKRGQRKSRSIKRADDAEELRREEEEWRREVENMNRRSLTSVLPGTA